MRQSATLVLEHFFLKYNNKYTASLNLHLLFHIFNLLLFDFLSTPINYIICFDNIYIYIIRSNSNVHLKTQ